MSSPNKSKGRVYFGAVVLVTLVLTACSAAEPTEEPMAVQETAEVMPTETPVYLSAPEGAIVADYDQVSFWFSSDIAWTWSAEYIPEGPGSSSSAGPVSHTDPEHFIFHLNDYVRVTQDYNPNLKGWIYVYPAPAMAEQNLGAKGRIEGLQDYLAAPPANLMDQTQQIPFLPLINGSQVFHSQVKFLDFQNGRGVRFITTIAQGFVPLSNGGIFYTYQGLTEDGAYYVAMIMPAANILLEGGPPEGYMDDPVGYFTGLAEQLDRQPASTFTPDLAALDALVESLLVRP